MRRAFVLTVSDGVATGHRDDESGKALEARLTQLGWSVERGGVPDEEDQVSRAVRVAAADHTLVMSTGGTGLGPRDRTPQALATVLDYTIAGFGEVMRAEGRKSTPLADLSRSMAGAIGATLVIAVPGSPRAALESLAAVEPLIDHALETLRGRTQQHPEANDAASARVPGAAASHDHGDGQDHDHGDGQDHDHGDQHAHGEYDQPREDTHSHR